MTFRVVYLLNSDGRSPFHVVETPNGREVAWVNRFLDRECARCLAQTTLRSYAMDLLHFVRWWAGLHHTDTIAENALGSVLPDYVRFQAGQRPKPAAATINRRIVVVDRALRNEFPDAPHTPQPGFSNRYWLRSSLGYGRARPALSRIRVK